MNSGQKINYFVYETIGYYNIIEKSMMEAHTVLKMFLKQNITAYHAKTDALI